MNFKLVSQGTYGLRQLTETIRMAAPGGLFQKAQFTVFQKADGMRNPFLMAVGVDIRNASIF